VKTPAANILTILNCITEHLLHHYTAHRSLCVVPYFSLPHLNQETLLTICPSVLQVSNKEGNRYEHKSYEMVNSITKKANKTERGRRRGRRRRKVEGRGEVEGKGEE
jgi:hypothetical protein